MQDSFTTFCIACVVGIVSLFSSSFEMQTLLVAAHFIANFKRTVDLTSLLKIKGARRQESRDTVHLVL